MITLDRSTIILASAVGGLLLAASLVGAVLKPRAKSAKARATIDNLNARTRSWWVMVLLFAAALLCGDGGVIVLFAFCSFQALREMISLSTTRRGDHHALFWAFFVILPIHYYLLCVNWYGLFAIFIPVYCFLFLSIRSTLAGDSTRYLERVAKIYWGLMICAYCISHAPALLLLKIESYRDPWRLLVYLVAIVQLSDVFQYCWGKLLGRHKIAPHISPNKTWEGFIGGVLTVCAVGTAMCWITPFLWWQSAVMSLTIALMGFFGGIVMSAIKRDAGVKDYGHLIEGHGGVMDRLDSLSFAAPVFFHVVRFYWANG